MKSIRIICALLCLTLLVVLLPIGASATSEAPYQTYTYDKWGNAVLSPNAYLPTGSYSGSQLGCGNFLNAGDVFYNPAREQIYIADSGNGRIVILTADMELVREISALTGSDGTEYQFVDPQGLFVLDDGTIYVADMAGGRVVVGTEEGTLISVLPTPESDLLPDNFIYKPHKVVVDNNGRIYVISAGLYQGLVYLEKDGRFIKYFGTNDVEMTAERRMLKFWKSVLPPNAAATLQDFNPIEYGNIFFSGDGYLYATAAASEDSGSNTAYYEGKTKKALTSKLVTKLNPVGIDCLPFSTNNFNELYSDVTVDEDGIMTLLDSVNGRINQYNESGDLLFSFGGTGEQSGLFQKASSIVQVRDKFYVMDQTKATLTEFSITQFGALVRQAITLYDDGLYQECMEPWNEVIRHNANYRLAYTGLGKAYYQLKDYETAMYYFKLANDRTNYSLAFKGASLNRMRSSFGWIILAVVLIVLAVVAHKILQNRPVPYRRKTGRKNRGEERVHHEEQG